MTLARIQADFHLEIAGVVARAEAINVYRRALCTSTRTYRKIQKVQVIK